MMNRSIVVVALALVSASLASYGAFLVARQVGTPKGPVLVPVLVAARPVALGTPLTREDIRVVSWPSDVRPEGTLTRVEDALDRSPVASLVANEPVVDAKLSAKGAGAGLLPTIAPGMRAVSVRVDEVIGVAGFVLPGTHVDVLVTIRGDQNASSTHLVAGNLQVLSAGTRIDQAETQREGAPIATSVVTLMVTPDDAERVALAQAEGRLTLTLRNPLDTEPTRGAGTRLSALVSESSRVSGIAAGGAATTAPASAPRPTRPVAPSTATARRTPSNQLPEPAPSVVASRPAVEAIRGTKRTEESVK